MCANPDISETIDSCPRYWCSPLLVISYIYLKRSQLFFILTIAQQQVSHPTTQTHLKSNLELDRSAERARVSFPLTDLMELWARGNLVMSFQQPNHLWYFYYMPEWQRHRITTRVETQLCMCHFFSDPAFFFNILPLCFHVYRFDYCSSMMS